MLVPPGWVLATVGDVLRGVEAGKSEKTLERRPVEDDVGVVKVSAVTWGEFDPAESKAVLPSRFDHSKSIRSGDLLFSRANTAELAGAVVHVKGDHPRLMLSDKILRLLPHDELAPRYLMYSLRTADSRRHLEGSATGTSTSMRNITQENLRTTPLQLPPAPEQQRIVAKLDATFEQTRAAKTRLERLPALFEKLKRSALAAACSGRLTGNSLADGEFPSSWRWATLQDLVVGGGIFDGARDHGSGTSASQNLRTSDYTSSGVRVIRLENLAHLAFLDDKRTYISQEKFAGLKQSAVQEGDILFGSFIDDSVRVCSLPDLGTPAIAKADCFCIRPRAAIVLPAYLLLQLACQRTRDALDDEAHGLTRLRITTKQLRAIRVPLCSMEVQHQVVQKMGAFLVFAASIQRAIATATARSAKLEQAALAKAFRGELVPQDPADEPASVFLDRIRAVRAAEPEIPRRGRGHGRDDKAMRTTRGANNGHTTNGDHDESLDLVVGVFQIDQRLTTTAITEATGLDAYAVKKALATLIDSGQVRVHGRARGTTYEWAT